MKNVQIEEGSVAIFRCELSKAGQNVEWMKGGDQVIRGGEKYQMRQRDTLLELRIPDVKPDDSDIYTCICGNMETTATLTVNGREFLHSIKNSVTTFFFQGSIHTWVQYPHGLICNDIALSFSASCHLQTEAKKCASGGREQSHAIL